MEHSNSIVTTSGVSADAMDMDTMIDNGKKAAKHYANRTYARAVNVLA